MPNQPKTPVRSHRIPDEEYLPAMAKAKAEGMTGTALVRTLLRKYVLGALIVGCFVGAGWLASGYTQGKPYEKPDNSKTVWKDITPNRAPAPNNDKNWSI